MRYPKIASRGLAGLVCTVALVLPGASQAQEKPKVQVQIPEPGVPEIMTMEGKFVRAAFNNEGYVILGYQVANRSVGEEWMLLDFGLTLRDGVPSYTFRRDAVSLETPDGATHALPSIMEHREGNTRGLENRAKVQRDSINYFPPNAHQACRIGFFAELEQRALPWDKVELSDQRACLGRLFFQVPTKIAHGQHFLNVKFAKSVIRVPFRILTKEEDKFLEKNYKDIEKQLEEAFKKNKK
jgi:hypothetical protein